MSESPLLGRGRGEAIATIGSFDGVHRGHRCLLDQVRHIADERGMESMAVTFGVSPKRVLGLCDVPQLTTIEERVERLHEAGIDRVEVLDFTRGIAAMTAHDFMRQVLHEQLGVKVLVIGYDHRFGHNRSEGFDDYVRHGREIGMEVIRGEVCTEGAEAISSTRIRGCLSQGDVAEAARLLGYGYRLCGKVVGGYRVGRKIGFPTANIDVECDKLIPADGVYAVRVQLSESQLSESKDCLQALPSDVTSTELALDPQPSTLSPRSIGMLNIGHRPTVNNGTERSVEVHIIGFEGNLYGQSLCIEFVERLRDERSFNSLDELTAQLTADKDMVMQLSTLNSQP